MDKAQIITCTNESLITFVFTILWRREGDDDWTTANWSGARVRHKQTRSSPDLASIGVPADAVAVMPYARTTLGRHHSGLPPVQYAANGQIARYEARGTTDKNLELTYVPLKLSNWSHTIDYNPVAFYQPKTTAELQEIVRESHRAGRKVRPRGSGHSWNQAIVTKGVSINTARLDLDVEPSVERVTVDGAPYLRVSVPASMRQGAFAELLQSQGAPLPTQGPAPDITLSGFVANGCHGTGWDQPTIAELVYGLQIVGPDGELLDFDETTVPASLKDLGISAPEMMQLVRVNLGALGVISRITFQLPATPFNIHVNHKFPKLKDVFDRDDPSKLQAYLDEYDYIEIFWFPYNSLQRSLDHDSLWVIAYNRTDAPVSDDAEQVLERINRIDRQAKLGAALGNSLARTPGMLPIYSGLAQLEMRRKYRDAHDMVFAPVDAFLYQKHYFHNFNDLEFTIPMRDDGAAQVTAAFYQLADKMDAWRESGDSNPYPVNLNVHARFIKNSQATLSPAYAPAGSSTHTCYIEYLSYSNGRLTDDLLRFSQAFYAADNDEGWKRYRGLPNWGKYLPSVPGIYAYVHELLAQRPGFETFRTVRERVDPGGATFGNPYLEAMFTGVAPPERAPAPAEAVSFALAAPAPAAGSDSAEDAELSIATPAAELHPYMHAELPEFGPLTLVQAPERRQAWLYDEFDEAHALSLTADEEGGVRYRVDSRSLDLDGAQVIARLGALLEADDVDLDEAPAP